ncbi:hypothetical protein M422DRAFT_56123 [Sphaerobolus stellatus SS14]|uniref:Unplaced genomic scaffold SPHSTscaffold_357, whole genome shotgun sequence n=1 Tax=Sphaerobolus stellatus (strain SS14) TaxID=990650 RepID=A0A0C9UIA7_SPHS4|nr:hypothetical protein M422DRAFT_56123 [Sphaerobolus stellatus SS14]
MTDTEYLPVNVQTPLWSCSCGSTPLSFLFRPHNPTSILILLELVQRSHVIEVYVLLMWYTNSAPIKCEVSRDSSLYRCFPVRILFYSAPLGSSSSTQQLKLVLVNSIYPDDRHYVLINTPNYNWHMDVCRWIEWSVCEGFSQ